MEKKKKKVIYSVEAKQKSWPRQIYYVRANGLRRDGDPPKRHEENLITAIFTDKKQLQTYVKEFKKKHNWGIWVHEYTIQNCEVEEDNFCFELARENFFVP